MIKSVSELKELIIWAKSQKLRALKIGDIQFELSDLALVVDEANLVQTAPVAVDSNSLAESEQLTAEEEEKLLYWSSR